MPEFPEENSSAFELPEGATQDNPPAPPIVKQPPPDDIYPPGHVAC